jgi:hypothetical protein
MRHLFRLVLQVAMLQLLMLVALLLLRLLRVARLPTLAFPSLLPWMAAVPLLRHLPQVVLVDLLLRLLLLVAVVDLLLPLLLRVADLLVLLLRRVWVALRLRLVDPSRPVVLLRPSVSLIAR